MALPMMPKATAVWLVENTVLTFSQIAAFCGLHELEVQAIADDEVAVGMSGLDPVAHNQLSQAELDRCQADSKARLELAQSDIPKPVARTKGARYTPVSKRQDKPDAIAWLLRFFPELTDAQIGKLLGTTKPTINAVRERSHWNTPNIRPRNPVELGMCAQGELDLAVDKAKKRVARAEARTKRTEAKVPREGASALAMAGAPSTAEVPAVGEAPYATPESPATPGAPQPPFMPEEEPKPAPKASVASVFGTPPPEPVPTGEPVLTAEDVFGASKRESEATAAKPAAAPEEATPEPDAAPKPQAAEEEPTPRPQPPAPGGSDLAAKADESGEGGSATGN